MGLYKVLIVDIEKSDDEDKWDISCGEEKYYVEIYDLKGGKVYAG